MKWLVYSSLPLLCPWYQLLEQDVVQKKLIPVCSLTSICQQMVQILVPVWNEPDPFHTKHGRLRPSPIGNWPAHVAGYMARHRAKSPSTQAGDAALTGFLVVYSIFDVLHAIQSFSSSYACRLARYQRVPWDVSSSISWMLWKVDGWCDCTGVTEAAVWISRARAKSMYWIMSTNQHVQVGAEQGQGKAFLCHVVYLSHTLTNSWLSRMVCRLCQM